ncbi:MAG: bifunctional phosphopantothenoylcysteine decarboxylase/phosphopantothenate--cysteine ligase CoaBC [Armatimonadetes bacterium]|nr:bifunctional phosphopantothenoylcysteine decarboxylase/phosphopantothenate--cysteine ligase CoaBC [Armatimonadota bacterium]
MTGEALKEKNVILGVTGSIAAFKAAEICSLLIRKGATVHVVMTEHATKFVGPVTFRALTGNQVITGLWDEPREYEIAHISLPDKADVFLIAPATANFIGKVAAGIADDMLTTMVMATKAPVVIAPAMNYKMWENPILQSNVESLKSLGYRFVGPETGRLACGVEAVGRLASPEAIVQAVVECISGPRDLEGVGILVTAGPTEEPLDPVRFISNRSSGKMGYAIAQVAANRGAKVTLVSGPTTLPQPAGVELVCVRTAAEMLEAVLSRLSDTDVIIGAAAVADYTPKSPAPEKIKKANEALVLELEPTKDIMFEVGRRKNNRILIGFAAETENTLENARKKLAQKNLDLIVANDVSKPEIGFGSDVNEVTLIERDGTTHDLPRMLKSEIAARILDWVKEHLNGGHS